MWIPNDPASIDHIVIAERPNTSMYISIFKQNLIYQKFIVSMIKHEFINRELAYLLICECTSTVRHISLLIFIRFFYDIMEINLAISNHQRLFYQFLPPSPPRFAFHATIQIEILKYTDELKLQKRQLLFIKSPDRFLPITLPTVTL